MAARKRTTAQRKKASKYAQVTVETLDLDDIADADYNPRLISQEAMAGLTQSLLDFGLLTHLVVNKTPEGYVMVGGHQRRKILRDGGVTAVDCIVVEFDPEQERHANYTLNNREIQGEFVPELLKDVLQRIREGAGDGHKKLFERLRFDTLYRSVVRQLAAKTDPKTNGKITRGKTRDDDIPNLARSKAVSQDGVLYALGDHRIYCGKVTAPGTLTAFGVEKADLAFSRFAQDDPFTDEFLEVTVGHVLQNTEGAVYLATHFDSLAAVQGAFDAMGGHWSNTLMCSPPDAKGRRDDLYRDVVVPVLYGWREGAHHAFYGGRRSSNLLSLEGSPPKTDVAVEVVVAALQNSSRPGDLVLDAFMAHGATLIAAEKAGRKLLGYVGSPREMDRIRHRWTRFVHGTKADWRKKTGEAA
jgi:hypothetical protein